MARTAKQKAAQRKAALASARKRRGRGGGRRNARLNKRISRTRSRTNKRVNKYAAIATRNAYTHSQHGGVYLNGRGVKAIKKGNKIHLKGQRKIAKLKSKKRR